MERKPCFVVASDKELSVEREGLLQNRGLCLQLQYRFVNAIGVPRSCATLSCSFVQLGLFFGGT